MPIVGDWDGDGKDNIGVRMGYTFYLRTSPVTSATETTTSFGYGNTNWVPVIGDWDGDGTDTPSAYDPATGIFHLSNNPATGAAQYSVKYGNDYSTPVAGDWDGDGKDNVGVPYGLHLLPAYQPGHQRHRNHQERRLRQHRRPARHRRLERRRHRHPGHRPLTPLTSHPRPCAARDRHGGTGASPLPGQ